MVILIVSRNKSQLLETMKVPLVYLGVKMVKVVLICVLSFLKCKQGKDFIADETTVFLLRKRGKLKGRALCLSKCHLPSFPTKLVFTNPTETLHRPPTHISLPSPSPRKEGLPSLLVTFYIPQSQIHKDFQS